VLVDSGSILQELLQVFRAAEALAGVVVEIIVVGEAELFEVVGLFLPLSSLSHAAAAKQDDCDQRDQEGGRNAL
jgi:hypothetical protein